MRTITRILVAAGALVLPAVFSASYDAGSAAPEPVAPSVREARDVIGWSALEYYGRDGRGDPIAYLPTSAGTFSASAMSPAGVPSAWGDLIGSHPTPETWDHPLQAVWTERCSQRLQVVRFSRTVFLPGEVAGLYLSLRTVTAPQTRKNPVAWSKVLVNGEELLRLERGERKLNHAKIDGYEPGILLNGANKITVVAKKSETKRAWGFCHPTPEFGVAAELFVEPVADLYLEEQADAAVTTTGADLFFDLGNSGPSTAAAFHGSPGVNNGQFSFSTGRSEVGTDVTGVRIEGIASSGYGPVNCYPPASDPFDLTCTIPDLLSMIDTVQFTVHIDWTPAPACSFEVPVTVSTYHAWDPDTLNNGLSWVLRTPGCPD